MIGIARQISYLTVADLNQGFHVLPITALPKIVSLIMCVLLTFRIKVTRFTPVISEATGIHPSDSYFLAVSLLRRHLISFNTFRNATLI